MFPFWAIKEDTLEDIEAQIEAKEKVLSLIGAMSVNDKQTLERLYYKRIILQKAQQTRESGK